MDSAKEKCVAMETQITYLTRFIATQSTLALTDNKLYSQVDILKKRLAQIKIDYKLNGCVAKVEDAKQERVKEIIDTYQSANKERVDNRIFIGFKDMLKDTLLSLGGASEYYYYNSIIYLGRKNQETLPYEGTITVNPATQIIEGNYKITVIKNNTKTEKQHHFKGRKL